MLQSGTGGDTGDDDERSRPTETPDGGDTNRPLLATEASEERSSEQAPEGTCTKPEDDGIPYDKGWAWMVVVGSFVHFGVFIGFLKSCGVIFVELLRRFRAPATQTTLIFGIRSGVYSVTGLYIMNVVVPRLGARKTVLIGSILVSLSTILASLTNDLTSLICVHSVLMGMGSAMLVPPGIVLIGSYFRKRRSLAIAIGKCGGSVGGMALPPLVTYFLSEYGLRGALLLTGGLFLHCLPAALLLRPVSFYSRRHRPLSRKPAACDTQSHETQNGEEGEVTSHEDVDTGSDKTKLPILDNVHGETAGVQCRDTNVSSCNNFQPHSDCGPMAGKDTSSVNNTRQTGLVRLFHERECTGCAKNSGVAGISRSSQDVGGRPAAYDTAFSLRRAHSISDHFRYKDFANGTSAAVQMLANGPDGYTSTSLADRKEVTTEVKGNSDGVNVHQPATHRFEEEGHCCMNKDCWVKGHAQSTDTLGADELSPEAGKESGGRMCSRLTHLISAVFLLDLSLLRSALFRLLLLHVIMAGFVYNVTDYLPAVAAENGINNRDAALLLTIVSGLDFVCRFLSGVIADLKVVRVSTMVVISLVVVGIAAQFVRFMTSFPLFVVLAVVHGLMGGVFGCLLPILIIDFVGLENMSKGYGFCQLVSGASLAAIYPMLGFVRDTTGSYAAVYHVIGCGLLGAAGLMGCEGLVRRQERRSAEKERKMEKQSPL